MLSTEEQLRYNRQVILPEIGIEGQIKLKQTKVLVVGAGGLGSPVLIYLAAAGIGEIGIIDNDIVDLSNLQRQVLYSVSDIGQQKANKAKERLINLNHQIIYHSYDERLSNENAFDIINSYDLVVECTDNIETRNIIDIICEKQNKMWVYGSVYKFEGQVAIFNPSTGKTYRNLFQDTDSEKITAIPSSVGLIGVLPSIIGSIQANEVIKLIIGMKENLINKLLIMNIQTYKTQVIKF